MLLVDCRHACYAGTVHEPLLQSARGPQENGTGQPLHSQRSVSFTPVAHCFCTGLLPAHSMSPWTQLVMALSNGHIGSVEAEARDAAYRNGGLAA